MASAASTRSAARAKRKQAVIGLMLAAAITGAWVALHIYAMFVFELTLATLPLALAMAAAQCWLSVGLFIISHDAMHGSLIPQGSFGPPTSSGVIGRINSAIGGGLLFLYAGFGWRKMRDAHFTHHRLAGHAGDPDFDEHNPRSFMRWYGTFLKRYFGLGSVIYVFAVVLAYWLVFGVPVEKITLLYGLPAIGSSVQLFYFGTFRPHRHDRDTFADRHNARSENFSMLASLASCYHFGYHHEHHLYPDTPWWGLPRKRRAVVSERVLA